MERGWCFADQVRQFIKENFLHTNNRELRDDTCLMEAKIVDSTGLLELIMFLEEIYGIHIEDDELVPANLDTIENIDRFLGRKLATVGQPEGSLAT
ncbi:MAG: acyl carrier protein [Sedimentisphaerales bacterium]|jgi:acyl carrier protein|nr:acyl carrier protein [Sedimentisphaerales bacterium]